MADDLISMLLQYRSKQQCRLLYFAGARQAEDEDAVSVLLSISGEHKEAIKVLLHPAAKAAIQTPLQGSLQYDRLSYMHFLFSLDQASADELARNKEAVWRLAQRCRSSLAAFGVPGAVVLLSSSCSWTSRCCFIKSIKRH